MERNGKTDQQKPHHSAVRTGGEVNEKPIGKKIDLTVIEN